MSSFLEWLLILILDRCYRVFRKVFHYVLTVAYWSRGQTVPPVTDPILKISATELAKQIREGKLKSETVIQSYIKRIYEVDPFINAITERRFNDALREAREVDALIASGSSNRQKLVKDKPLLGVPFTVKAIFTVKGLPYTLGSLLYKDLWGHEDAPSVTLMKEAGGILLATTNIPEIALNVESSNNVYGTTCNPYNTSRTSGGSSGGECALLGAAGSLVGLGNDLAGSVRLPAMYCGVFGHKPTSGLVPNEGCMILPGAMDLLYTGPMCRYAGDLLTTMKILTSQNKKNTTFEKEVSLQGLKVFYICSLGRMPFVEEATKDMQDAVKKVVSHFETKFGSKVELLNLPLLNRINGIWMHAVLSKEKNIADKIAMGKRKVNEILELVKYLFCQSVYTFAAILIMNSKNFPLIYKPDMVEIYEKLRQKLNDEFMNLLDDRTILVMPTWAFPAPYHGETSLSFSSSCYCTICNVLGLPSTQCPTGLNNEGLPVGVQVIGRKGNDALTIACAIELEKAFGGWLAPKPVGCES